MASPLNFLSNVSADVREPENHEQQEPPLPQLQTWPYGYESKWQVTGGEVIKTEMEPLAPLFITQNMSENIRRHFRERLICEVRAARHDGYWNDSDLRRHRDLNQLLGKERLRNLAQELRHMLLEASAWWRQLQYEHGPNYLLANIVHFLSTHKFKQQGSFNLGPGDSSSVTKKSSWASQLERDDWLARRTMFLRTAKHRATHLGEGPHLARTGVSLYFSRAEVLRELLLFINVKLLQRDDNKHGDQTSANLPHQVTPAIRYTATRFPKTVEDLKLESSINVLHTLASDIEWAVQEQIVFCSAKAERGRRTLFFRKILTVSPNGDEVSEAELQDVADYLEPLPMLPELVQQWRYCEPRPGGDAFPSYMGMATSERFPKSRKLHTIFAQGSLYANPEDLQPRSWGIKKLYLRMAMESVDIMELHQEKVALPLYLSMSPKAKSYNNHRVEFQQGRGHYTSTSYQPKTPSVDPHDIDSSDPSSDDDRTSPLPRDRVAAPRGISHTTDATTAIRANAIGRREVASRTHVSGEGSKLEERLLQLEGDFFELQDDSAHLARAILRSRELDQADDQRILTRLPSKLLPPKVVKRIFENPYFKSQRSRKRSAVDGEEETPIKLEDAEQNGTENDTTMVEPRRSNRSKKQKR